MSQDDQPNYNNSHRAFLQAFLSKSTFTLEEAKPVLAAILKAHTSRAVHDQDISEADFLNYVNVVNAAVSNFDFEIRSTLTQKASRTRVWAIVNTTSDAITQLSTTFTADEISFVKRVLDYMFERNNTLNREVLAIKRTDAQRLNKNHTSGRASGGGDAQGVTDGEAQGSTGGSITHKEAEKVLASLVDQDWFMKDGDYFTLSPRALMELRQWLMDTYNEPEDENGPAIERIKLCRACRDIVTIGQRCPRKQCPVRIHDSCLPRIFQAQRNEDCPVCHAAWTGHHFVGKRADDSGARRSANGRESTISAGADVDQSMEMDDEDE